MDNTKKCWYCGKDTMVNEGDYYQCVACGATWNSVPSCGASALNLTPEPIRNDVGAIIRHAYRSSPSVLRAARKARERKVGSA